MSLSLDSVRGFRPKYYEDGRSWSSRVVPKLIGNSQTIEIGGVLKIVAADGVHSADANGDTKAYVAVGFTVKNIPVVSVANNSAFVDGTYTVNINGNGDTYAAAADNLTDKQIVAQCVPVEGLVMSGKLDANAGTTTGSDLPEYYIDILAGNNAVLLDESSAVSNAVANFVTIAARGNEASNTDPEDPAVASRRILVKVAELQEVGVATRHAA